jgi:ribonuclease HII
MVVDGYGFITKDNKGRSYNLEGVVKGDGSILSIAAASILAKVTRDKYMCELSRTYPQYQYEKHKGYGTLVHRNAIKKWGISPQHRELFVRNIKAL